MNGGESFLGFEPDAQHLHEELNAPSVLVEVTHLIPNGEELVGHGVIGGAALAAAEQLDDLRVLQALELGGDCIEREAGPFHQVRRLGRASLFHQGMDDLPLLRGKILHLVLEERRQFVHQTPEALGNCGDLALAQQLVEHEDEPGVTASQVNDGTNLRTLLPEITQEAIIAVELRPALKQLEYLFGSEPVQRHRAEVVEERLVVALEGIKHMDRAADEHHEGLRHQQPPQRALHLVIEALLQQQVEVFDEHYQPFAGRSGDLP